MIPYLHEGLLEREELAELDGGGKHREGDDVGVVGVHLEGRVQRDVLITPGTIFCFFENTNMLLQVAPHKTAVHHKQ